MKQVAITGGKGGTGKSTVAILLANKLIKKDKIVLLCDCDVECPNDYLLIGEKLKKPVRKVFAEFPKLNKNKCQKCGLCSKTCQSNAIFQAPGKYPVFIKDLCSACGACWAVCPYSAITPKKEEVGKIYLNKLKATTQSSKLFYLITGVAKPGLEETGPVVIQVKEFALDFARKIKADYLLFDTAAGIHCPVISALLGCDFAYAVTEPTPMGAYDLNLILDLCKKLKIPAKVIINQADLGDKKEIKKIARKHETRIVKEIPYSKEIVDAYSQGRLNKL
ncbi:ATP-binding protein [Candidatus Parcubacteria bacterium]|nr:ATP-binding protein [Candidatus Parcubacteria bacterium]